MAIGTPAVGGLSISPNTSVNLNQFGGTNVTIGQQVASASIPVILPAATITTLTPPTSITANAGTNLNTSLLALESGGNLAGAKTDLDTLAASVVAQATALGSTKNLLIAGSVTTNAPTYTTGDINPLSLTTVGGLRIDLKDTASNTNNINVNVATALPAGTNVIGHVITDSGSVVNATLQAAASTIVGQVELTDGTNTQTFMSTTTTSKHGADVNLLSILGTAPTTAGKVDVKGADGDVFVRQSTASNLKAQVTGAGSAGTADSGVVTVQGISSMTPVKTDLSGSSANSTAGLISVKIDQTTVGSTNAVTPVPASNSGWSFDYQSALSSTKHQIKGTAGTFGGYLWLYNPNTVVTYIQIFNAASASVTVGSTTPDFVIALPGMASGSGTGAAANMEMVHGIAMSTGITVAATTTATGSTGPSNALVCTFLYK